MAKIDKQKKNKKPSEIIYGAHSLIEVLRAKKRKLLAIYTTKPLPKSWNRVKKYLPKVMPPIQYVSRNVLSSMAKTIEHMGIVAFVSPFQYRKKIFTPEKYKFLLLLDSIQDVHNLGAILRSAYCTGVDGVVLCKKNAAPLTGAAFKVSAGLAEHLEIYLAPSLKYAVLELKKVGYHFYMTVLQNGKNAMAVTYQKPMCLVIGNEASGIAKDIRGYGELITLPQKDPDISYNAAVAAGIFLFLLSQK